MARASAPTGRARAGSGPVVVVPARARGGGADSGGSAGRGVARRPAQGDVDRGGGRGGVAEIQRARMVAALVEVARERGVSGVTVAHIVARSGVSRRTFYELFEDRDDCFLAGFDLAVQAAARRVLPAYGVRGTWRERVRAGLGALLEYLDDEPGMGALCVVDALGAGPVALERRTRVVQALIDAVHEGRREARGATKPTRLTAEGVVGAVLAVLHARLAAGDARANGVRANRARANGAQEAGAHTGGARAGGVQEVSEPSDGGLAGGGRAGSAPPMSTLLGPLMGMIVLPYLGKAAAAQETSRPTTRRKAATAPSGDPLRELDMRLTYRTVQVLLAIAVLGGRGRGPSNRQVAEAAGVADPGQISKLLARLEHLGLIENEGGPPAPGEPHVWRLTPKGAEVERTIRRQATPAGA
jgi:AcrR family transcriptional regulator/DNA-binding MarR family transcriptional regulator